VDDATYTFNFHRDSILRLIERLDLNNIVLVCQDWGGILGLTLPMEMPERITRLLVMNTAIPTGVPVSDGFALWKGFAGMASEIPTGGLVALDAGDALNLFDVMAYDAPFPDNSYKAGVRRFPQMVPVEAEMEGAELGVAARTFFAEHWDGQAFMAIGMRDNVLNEPVMMELRSVINGCSEPMRVAEGGHFVQEFGEPIAREALKHFGLTN